MNKKDEKELIELLKEVTEIKDGYLPKRIQLSAYQLLCSINSNEPNEVESVGKNEQREEICENNTKRQDGYYRNKQGEELCWCCKKKQIL